MICRQGGLVPIKNDILIVLRLADACMRTDAVDNPGMSVGIQKFLPT